MRDMFLGLDFQGKHTLFAFVISLPIVDEFEKPVDRFRTQFDLIEITKGSSPIGKRCPLILPVKQLSTY
jgi:hypothetical protein